MFVHKPYPHAHTAMPATAEHDEAPRPQSGRQVTWAKQLATPAPRPHCQRCDEDETAWKPEGPARRIRLVCCGRLMCKLCWRNRQCDARLLVNELGRVEANDKVKRRLAQLNSCPWCRQQFPNPGPESVAHVQRMAERGKSWAENMLGQFHEAGHHGLRPDEKKAEKWYRSAIRTEPRSIAGGARASYNLGALIADRDDISKAKQLWKAASEAGDMDAAFSLACLYDGTYHEAGTLDDANTDHAKAFVLYVAAAKAGHLNAQINLGVCFEQSQGVAHDSEKAIAWYAEAAKQGSPEAMCNIARLLVRRDDDAAMPAILSLMRTAAEKKCVDALTWLPSLEQKVAKICGRCGRSKGHGTNWEQWCLTCHAVVYCSFECRKADRERHEHVCRSRNVYHQVAAAASPQQHVAAQGKQAQARGRHHAKPGLVRKHHGGGHAHAHIRSHHKGPHRGHGHGHAQS